MTVKGRRLSYVETAAWSDTGKLPTWTADEASKVRQASIFVGIDGEGQSDPITGEHFYTLLAAVSERGTARTIRPANGKRLTTDECLKFITSGGKRDKYFAYSFGYDLTKILEDLDDLSLYKLFRPELRRKIWKNRPVQEPIYWPQREYPDAPDWSLNYLNGRFSVRARVGYQGDEVKWGKTVIIHDIWRFFQGKFTIALEDWKVPGNLPKEERETILRNMREMKDKRSQFDRIDSQEIESYCLAECRYMAELARKVTEAHIQAGIPLKSYFGAGSSASAMLKVMDIQKHIAKSRETKLPEELNYAIACAFFGGRFENSVIGAVPGPLWSYDISSAYPYQITFLPCLIHGKWEHTTDENRVRKARAAVIHYHLHPPACIPKKTWGPYPFRLGEGKEAGSIVFPESGATGWLWQDEFFEGQKLYPNAEFLDAWVYECECNCQIFQKIPTFYKNRLRIGKEGPGIVLKLGTNSCYGKTAQFIGGEPGEFTSWVWAGLITSGCRAQILKAMGAHKDLRNMLMVATDGIASRERLTLDIPQDTGTFDAVDENGKPANKPLGGWEEKELPKGLFLARPGIYFPLNPTKEEIKKVRARGIGRGVVYEQWQKIVDAYEAGEPLVKVKDLSRFIGAKNAITRAGKPDAWRYTRSIEYGRWKLRPVEMHFHPHPKREAALKDGTLTLRRVQGESAPYDKSVVSEETDELRRLTEEALEQPDGGDLSMYARVGDENIPGNI
jgi:hypothetical protein